MTDDNTELVERLARIIGPSAWAVMDSYLEQTKRKYRGQHIGWPADQFHHKESMAKARAVLAAVTPHIEARAKLEGAKAMQEAFDIADAAPELNMSNYDHDQVDALNKAMNELHSVLKAALDPAQTASQEPKP